MHIGMGLGWTGEPVDELVGIAEKADRIGLHSVWSLEEYGPDAVIVLGYLAPGPSGCGSGRRSCRCRPGRPR